MENRLEILRKEIDKLIMNSEQSKVCMYSSHIYGTAKFCTLLALKRGMDVEISTICGMLHDVYYLISGSGDEHATKGAEYAEELLQSMDTYSEEEIKIITAAISRHSNKRMIDEKYDELLKDADVMDHCFYNNDFPIADWEIERYNNLLMELGINQGE